MANERPSRTEEERKQALEEALKRVRPQVTNTSNSSSLLGKLDNFAKKTEEQPVVEKPKEPKKGDLGDLGIAFNENAEKAKKAGLVIDAEAKAKGKEDPSKSKTKENERTPERGVVSPMDKDKDKDKEKDEKEKNKDKDEKDSATKQEQKMKEMFSKVKLPSGMEIHQEGPQWVLVSKDGKQRTDITDVMNTIDKYNRDVDTANNTNKMQNEAQGHVDKAVDVNKKDEGLTVNETNGNIRMVGEALPQVKDIDGNQVFKPEDMKKVAETALSFSDEKMKLEALKDPKHLEELQERKRENDRKADDKKKEAALKQFIDMRSKGQ